MRVLLVGDVHGHFQALVEILEQARSIHSIDAAVQVGDFGLCRERMNWLQDQQLRFPVPLHVIDGNHDDHIWLKRALDSGAAAVWQEKSNLVFQPRASVVTLGSSKIGFVGGALHVHRPQRHNWFPGTPNYIVQHEREKACALFNQEHPELIVTHSCPCGIGIGMRSADGLEYGVIANILGSGFDPGPLHDCGEAELTRLWEQLAYKPQGWVFGHFHRAHAISISGTRFMCISHRFETILENPVIWDTETKSFSEISEGRAPASPTSPISHSVSNPPNTPCSPLLCSSGALANSHEVLQPAESVPATAK